MESGKYVISVAGGNGQCDGKRQQTEYYYDCLDGYVLYESALCVYFGSKGTVFLSSLEESKEFVINLVNRNLTYACDFCGVRSGKTIDKFKALHLTAIPSKHVSVPSISESPVNIECKIRQIIPLGSHDMFLAEVVGVTIDDTYLDSKGRLDLNRAQLISYSHGEYYLLSEYLGKFGYSVRK